MSSLKDVVSEYLLDTLYEAEVILRSDRGKNLTILTDNLRGIAGITVVTVMDPAKTVSSSAERTKLKVKFFQVMPSMREQVIKMSAEARKVTGVYSFIVTKVNKVVSRIYRG